MRWYQSEPLLIVVGTVVIAAAITIGGVFSNRSHNSCVVEMAKAGKTVEEAKGVCK